MMKNLRLYALHSARTIVENRVEGEKIGKMGKDNDVYIFSSPSSSASATAFFLSLSLFPQFRAPVTRHFCLSCLI